MFSTETFQLDSERVYPLPFKITLNTKLREIQYKILYRICYHRDQLHCDVYFCGWNKAFC